MNSFLFVSHKFYIFDRFDYLAQMFPWLGRKIIRPFLLATRKIRQDPLSTVFDRTMQAVKERKMERDLGKQEEGKKAEKYGEEEYEENVEDEEDDHRKERVGNIFWCTNQWTPTKISAHWVSTQLGILFNN